MFREPNDVQQDLFMIFCVWRIAYCVLRIAYGVLRIAYYIFRIAYCVLPRGFLSVLRGTAFPLKAGHQMEYPSSNEICG